MTSLHVLVAGGAGYIGSHTVVRLIEAGHRVSIVDSFVNAKPTVVPRLEELTGATIAVHHLDLVDREGTAKLFADNDFDAVIHFAGLKAVGESAAQPFRYYDNNLRSTLSLIEAMTEHGCKKLVFSSSATVYGDNAPVPYVEDYDPLSAASPYGRTKVMSEHILHDVALADTDQENPWRISLLRYFNPVGAHPSGRIGEDPQGVPNNLMPFIAQVAVGRREQLSIFGGDYPTADGTCERDYIHVDDLAEGHVAALEHLAGPDAPAVEAFNLGSGEGTSVLALLQAFERGSGVTIPYQIVDRRPGDLAAYWANPAKANETLDWRTSRSIDDICRDTWAWQSANPQGYPD